MSRKQDDSKKKARPEPENARKNEKEAEKAETGKPVESRGLKAALNSAVLGTGLTTGVATFRTAFGLTKRPIISAAVAFGAGIGATITAARIAKKATDDKPDNDKKGGGTPSP